MRPTAHAIVCLLLAAGPVIGPGCSRDAAPEEPAPRADDPAAARALFDRAIVADLNGDALAAGDLMFELAARHPDTPHGRAARARVEAGSGSLTVAGLGILAAVAIPAFMKFQRRSKASEASMNVARMFDAALLFYEADHLGPGRNPIARRFPRSAPPTPDRPFCEDGDDGFVYQPDDWTHPGWQELGFALDGPHRYRYEFVSEGEGPRAMFTARAIGDLNCDGVLSTFERVGAVDEHGNVTGGAGLYVSQELE